MCIWSTVMYNRSGYNSERDSKMLSSVKFQYSLDVTYLKQKAVSVVLIVVCYSNTPHL